MAALGLRCCTWAFSSCGEWGLLFVAVRGLLLAVASLVAEQGLQACGLQQLWLAGSRAQAQQLWVMGLVALRHVGSSRTRYRTRVPCIGRQILNHCAPREVPKSQSLAVMTFFKKCYLFIYLFLAVLGLRFCARAFSSCDRRGPLFIAMRGPLTIAASLVAEHRLQTRRLSSCGSRAQLLCGMWDLPRPEFEPVSPALAGRFSTTVPPGKPPLFFKKKIN